MSYLGQSINGNMACDSNFEDTNLPGRAGLTSLFGLPEFSMGRTVQITAN